MNHCKNCEKEIEANYKYCAVCMPQMPIIKELQKLNNNLYAIRFQNNIILEKEHGVKVVWSKEKKDFVVSNLK